ncbi:MAG: 4-hydroxy-3-methylbut-2-enyl diphosphate reductase [Eggerthellaceae bacterium]|nr:4-hydroxy-3-methylbut-2-enyl diphosphate reductase [Eggerthellaceae bacterium]
MQVILAKHAGTCFGVNRALVAANKALKDPSSVSCLGPLIHNPQVVHDLAMRGLDVVESPEDIWTRRVIIRSHGVAPDVRRALEASDAEIIDATCPFVLRAQEAAARLGREQECVIIVGEAGHPEVEALEAFAGEGGARVICALGQEDLPEDLPDRVGIVVQTTQRASILDAVLETLKSRGIETDVANTICNATTRRQDAAMDLASQVDAMVVVGGRNSSNTKRLAEICSAICPNVFHIENLNDFTDEDLIALSSCTKIGLTAGASTPEDQIRTVRLGLEAL